MAITKSIKKYGMVNDWIGFSLSIISTCFSKHHHSIIALWTTFLKTIPSDDEAQSDGASESMTHPSITMGKA